MKLIQAIYLTLLISICVGCASHNDVKVAKEQALLASAEANSTADQALSTAREAKAIAEQANERSKRNEEMLNRSFKRSMYK